MAAPAKEKIILAAAALLALASTGVFGALAWRNAPAPGGPVDDVKFSDAPYVPTATDAPAVKTDLWNQPVAQSRGRDWVYDTFTPPEIFYSARSKHFTVKPPIGVGDDTPEEPFGLELVLVRPEPYRLQLIGYVGAEGDWRGTFQNVATGEVFLAAAGHSVPSLGLSIKSLEVRTASVAVAQSMATRQRTAKAVIHDQRSGTDVTLTHRERRFTGALTALVAPAGDPVAREVREGGTFKLGPVSYRVEKISLAPPTVEVTKESPTLAQPDRRTLTPRESEELTATPDAPTS